MKWVIQPSEDGLRGKSIPCPNCSDSTRGSGLTTSEAGLTWDRLIDLPNDTRGYVRALRKAGQMLLDRRFGFATVYGNFGTAKSLFGKIVVAEACRQRFPARYEIGKRLEKMLFSDTENDGEINGTILDMMRRRTVLIIDEAHAINWRNQWIAGEMMSLFEERYRMATERRALTIFIAQTHPRDWGPQLHVGALMSRAVDGSFGLPWPDDEPEPAPHCLAERPCFCGHGVMKLKPESKGRLTCSKCNATRPVEIYWPFGIDTADIRPILPPLRAKTEEELRDEERAYVYAQ